VFGPEIVATGETLPLAPAAYSVTEFKSKFATYRAAADAVIVVVADAVLFAGFGSAWLAPAVAVLVRVPGPAGATTTVTVAEEDTAMDPRLHWTVPPLIVQEPWVLEAEATPVPGDMVSVTPTPVAVLGPPLLATTVSVTSVPAVAVAGAVSVTATSAEGPAEAIVVVLEAELLEGFGSASFALAAAVVVKVPAAAGVAIIVTVADDDTGSGPSRQVTVDAEMLHVPWVAAAELTVAPDVTDSLTVTPVADCGPLFVTTTVEVTGEPWTPVAGAVSLTARSAPVVAETTMLADAELLAGFGSAWLAPTVAVLVTVPDWGAVATMVTVAAAPLASEPTAQATVVVPAQVPWEELEETKVSPAGRVSVTPTPVAVDGPLLVATRV
jgi:hypothetical protein